MTTININQSLLNITSALAVFVGGAAALALLYAAYLLIFAGDDSTQELKARKIIGFAIVGAVLGLGAVTLSNLITGQIK
jgi:hypothetical protein